MKEDLLREANVPARKREPVMHMVRGEPDEIVEFGVPLDQRERELTFAVPPLPGMDELHTVRAELRVTAHTVEQPPLAVPPASASARTLALPHGDPRVGALARVVVKGLVVEGAPALGWGFDANLDVTWSGDQVQQGMPAGCLPLRFLARLPQGDGFGPPAAAAPAFKMPGPGALYGDALAGATLRLSLHDGKLDATLTFDPPLESRAVELLIAVVPEAGALPHLATPVAWRADSIDATWSTRLRGLEIDARLPALPDEPPAPVASFPGLAAGSVGAIDFSAAARSLLRTAHAQGQPPTLALHMKSGSVGKLAVDLKIVEAEYRKTLAAELAVALRGGVERASLPLPPGLAPSRFTLTLDGRFGPHALVASADTGELDPSAPVSGYRVADTLVVARWLPLTVAEAARPLTRVSVEGRGAGDCELLLSLHRGDPLRIGARHGDPVALAVPTEGRTRWHRAELGKAAAAPPHPGGVWVVVQVSRGSFWWAARFADDAGPPTCQRSPDAGATWDARPGRPRAQVHQLWLDDGTHEPLPEPVRCLWKFGKLHDDIRPVEQLALPAFRAVGLPLLGEREPLNRAKDKGRRVVRKLALDRVDELGPALELAFDCRRDVDFRLLDAVMTYPPPWEPER